MKNKSERARGSSNGLGKAGTICLVLLIAIPSVLLGLALSNVDDLPATKWIIGGSAATLVIITMMTFKLGVFKNYTR